MNPAIQQIIIILSVTTILFLVLRYFLNKGIRSKRGRTVSVLRTIGQQIEDAKKK